MINGKNSEEFKKFLKDMLTKRNATENIMEALNIIDGEFEYALDGGPTSVQMQTLQCVCMCQVVYAWMHHFVYASGQGCLFL